MMDWFANLSVREHWLVGVAGLLVLVFASWQFAIKPITQTHVKAEKSQSVALRDFDIVQSGLANISSIDSRARLPFDRAAVLQTASQSNVAISRVQPGQNEALQVWFDDTQTANVYDFLTQVTAKYNARIGRVQITQRAGGLVSAQITLQPNP